MHSYCVRCYTFYFISLLHCICCKRHHPKYFRAELGLRCNKMLLLPRCHFSFLSFYRCNEEQRIHLSPSLFLALSSLHFSATLSIPQSNQALEATWISFWGHGSTFNLRTNQWQYVLWRNANCICIYILKMFFFVYAYVQKRCKSSLEIDGWELIVNQVKAVPV